MPTPRGPRPKPKISRRKSTTDGKRKYDGSGAKGDPFTIAEIREYVIEPLELVADNGEFNELANWCASESPTLLQALYKACKERGMDDWATYLEGAYGSGNS